MRSVDELVAAAISETGLDDFGAGPWRDGLTQLLASLEADAGITPAAEPAVELALTRMLGNRLKVSDWVRANGDVVEQTVDGPLLVCGLPRTGTTALAGMLACDPRTRSLRAWEAASPVPPPVFDDEHDDPRRLAAAAQRELLAEHAAEIMKMHLLDPLGPEEPHDVTGMTFVSQYYAGVYPVRSYGEWWLGQSLRPTFAFEHLVLKMLQSRRPPNTWMLKAPYYVFHLDDFAAEHPGARFVMTHRDPAHAVPSQLSLLEWVLSGVTDSRAVILDHLRWLARLWAQGMRRGIAARQRIGEDRFLDVYHVDLVADPIREVERIYAFMDRALGEAAHAAIQAFTIENRSQKHGTHEYSAEQFNLTPDGIRAEYADYIAHYSVPA